MLSEIFKKPTFFRKNPSKIRNFMCKIIYFIVRICIIKLLLCRSKKIPPCKFIIFSDATEKSIDNTFILYYNLCQTRVIRTVVKTPYF